MNCHLELAKFLIYKDFSKSKHIKGLKCLLKNNLVVADEQEKNAHPDSSFGYHRCLTW